MPNINSFNNFIIYKVTNNINGMAYIGMSTRGLKVRKKEHFDRLIKRETYLTRAMRKYGSDNFNWEIICDCPNHEELKQREIKLIKFYGTRSPGGYNLTDGGDGMLNPIAETREKLSAAGKGRKMKPPTDEQRRNLSVAAKLRRYPSRSDEYRAKMSAALRGKKRVPFSDERKAKLSATMMGRKLPPPTVEARMNRSAGQYKRWENVRLSQ